MVRKTLYLLVAAANLLLAACVKDTLETPEIGIDDSNEVPVEFQFDVPEFDTRAMTVPTRTEFEDGDVIHVIATFKHENNKKGEYTSQRYGAMVCDDNGKWTAMPEATLRWPYDAVSGHFEAYFVPISSDKGSATGAHEGPLTEVSNSSAADGGNTDGAADDAWMNDSDDHWINFSWLNETTRVIEAGEDAASAYSRSQYLDPLHAVSEPGIEYGHAVRMRFKHVLTHLSFLNLTPATSFSTYRLRLTEKDDKPSEQELPTQYRLVLKRENDALHLGIYYRTPADAAEQYISTKPLKNQQDIFSGGDAKVDYANFYLPPTFTSDQEDDTPIDYANLVLQSEFDHTYLTFHYKGEDDATETPGGDATQSPDGALHFETGRPYYIDVKRDKGVVITPDDSMGWEEPQGVFEVNVPHFLYAATTPGVDYIYKDKDGNETPILTWNTSQSVVTLQVDVCFGYFDDYSYGDCGGGFYPTNPEATKPTDRGFGDQVWWDGKDVSPSNNYEYIFHVDLPQTVIFDGNNHSICHVAHPIFRNVFGGIRNLAIRHADVIAESRRLNKEGRESTELYQGILCQILHDTGTIDRVLLDNAHLEVSVDNTIYYKEAEQDTHALGLLVGFATTAADETTDISNIFLRGDNQILVKYWEPQPETEQAERSVRENVDINVGGLVGQCSSTTIDNISWLYSTPESGSDHKISEDTCEKGHEHDSDHKLAKQNALRVLVQTGENFQTLGSLNIGGLLGTTAGNLWNVLNLDNVTVDASNSTFKVAYTGGLIGVQTSNKSTDDKSIENCQLNCTVKAPTISSSNEGASRTGGLVGRIQGTDAKNILLICDVTGSALSIPISGNPEFSNDTSLFAVGGVFGNILTADQAAKVRTFSDITVKGRSIDGKNSTISEWNNGVTTKLAIGQFVGVASSIYDPSNNDKWNDWMKDIKIQITGLDNPTAAQAMCGWFE